MAGMATARPHTPTPLSHMLPPFRALTLCLLGLAACGSPLRGPNASVAPPVAPADLSRLQPADFTDEELDLPYYLAHFHRVANGVRMEGENRGFIDISVWRRPKDNAPYNARVMENLLSLVYFYTTDRPWNPYRGDPALRARLEAALRFWVRIQAPDGKFSEYGPQQWSLAPTAFATKFMGEALRLLHGGPPIDSTIHRQVVEADRRAIVAVLTDPGFYQHGLSYSNQYGNVWPGALAYLSLYPDAELERLVHEQMERASKDHQSPVGYFYELDGPDWGYNLGTHHSNVHMAWHYARGTAVGDSLIAETRRWYDWFGYNAVPEPGQPGLTTNRGPETRQRRPVVTASGQVAIFSGHEQSAAGFPLAEQVELARLLVPTREQLQAARTRRRTELERTWPAVEPLRVGEFSDVVGGFSAYSPYAFLHRDHVQWFPTEEQRSAAVAALPHIAAERFTHQRVDTRKALTFTFVRRPAYYAAFNAGEVLTPQQRYGLGLLWIPGTGSVLQSQTATEDAAWGSRAADRKLVYEAASFHPTFQVNGRPVRPEPGSAALPEGPLEVRYDLGSRGRKSVLFGERGITVSVQHTGDFVEQLPLLLTPGDELRQEPGRIELQRGGTGLVLRFDRSASADIRRTGERVGAMTVHVVRLTASDSLRYQLQIRPGTAMDAKPVRRPAP